MPYYLEAIERARRAGAAFIEGVASVALASARTRTGDVAGAAEGFGYLLDYWRRTGQTTQLWTTARNAAGLLSQVGTAADGRAAADLRRRRSPGRPPSGREIARYSGRAFAPVADLVPDDQLAELRAEAGRLGADGVLDLPGRSCASWRGRQATARPRET